MLSELNAKSVKRKALIYFIAKKLKKSTVICALEIRIISACFFRMKLILQCFTLYALSSECFKLYALSSERFKLCALRFTL